MLFQKEWYVLRISEHNRLLESTEKEYIPKESTISYSKNLRRSKKSNSNIVNSYYRKSTEAVNDLTEISEHQEDK